MNVQYRLIKKFLFYKKHCLGMKANYILVHGMFTIVIL